MDEKQLREELMKVWTEYRGISEKARAENRGLADAERERRTVLEGEIARLERDIESAGKEAEIAKRIAGITNTQLEVAGRQGAVDPEKRYHEVFTKYVRFGPQALGHDEFMILNGRVDEGVGQMVRDMGIATGAAGGYLVPEAFWNKVTEVEKVFSSVMQVCQTLTTSTGNTIPWPSLDDTANEGEILGENTATTLRDIELGTKNLGAYMFTSRMTRLSLQLLQDSVIDIEGMVARVLGKRIGRRLNRALTTGTGIDEPEGIVNGLPADRIITLGVGNTAIGDTFWKNLIDLEHKVDPAYREGGNVRWMFNDTSLAAIQKAENDNGDPLWIPSIREGVPGLVLGRPYTVNNNMASAGANNVSVLFGDFSEGYIHRVVTGGSMLRLGERYAEALQVAFLGFERHDGLVDNASALAALKHSAS